MLSIQPWQLNALGDLDQRSRLAKFWLACPEDQLEMLWQSPIGEACRQLIRQLTPSAVFPPDQVQMRDQLNARLSQSLEAPGSVQVLIATFLFSPPGLFAIQGPERYLPSWLIADYHSLYSQTSQPAEPQLFRSPQPAVQTPQPAVRPSAPDFGVFPSSLQELQANRLQLNRMLGLANLYYIDPEDQEIRSELEQLRLELSQVILRCPEEQLESIFVGDLGDRYWAMVRSGIQKEALSREDQALKDQITQKLSPASGGGFGQPGAINAMLVAMLYFVPGSMKVDGADQKLPTWLLSGYQEIFAKPLEATA